MHPTPSHTPVLRDTIIEQLRLQPGACCVDATVGAGGHATAILEATAPDGTVLGIDRDPEMIAALQSRLSAEIDSGRLRLAVGSFRDLDRILSCNSYGTFNAVLLDVGVSSFHFDASGRGFSFARTEPLDMRFDPSDATLETAAQILAARSAEELASLFRDLGEERFASRIARTLVARRRDTPLESTDQLMEAVTVSLPAAQRWRASRHAARVFQALRIAVNDELGAIAEVLPQALAALVPGGRLAVISFHSLEDRLVKLFLREESRAGHLRIITKKPLRPTEEEVAANPRAASAKLRVGERIE